MRIGMGLVGAGFVGPHHVDAVRRLGFVDVVAVAGSSDESARERAKALHIPQSYGTYEALIADPAVHVVHVTTPTSLHVAVASAAIAAGKHVVSDKPLATSAADAQLLVERAKKAGIVHAVTFNYRGNPLVQQARQAIARGDIGAIHFIHGHYLQDWLLEDTDYSWRLEPDKSGGSSALADIGSHWTDLVEHISGLRIGEVLGTISTVIRRRRKPASAKNAFGSSSSGTATEWVDMTLEDLASVLLRFSNGASGSLSVGQVCAGHKNDLALELCGASGSIGWRQEQQNELWFGYRHRANATLHKDPALVDTAVREYTRLPGGHQEAWADAFCNVMRDIYTFIASGHKPDAEHPPAFATFEDGHRAARIVEAILASARAGSVWTQV